MTPERLLDVSVVARLLRVTPQTVRNWIRLERLRSVSTVSGRRQVPASELARLQKLQKVQSRPG